MKNKVRQFLHVAVAMTFLHTSHAQDTSFVSNGNPIITHKYTADPGALVYKDTLFIYAGHDEAAPKHEGYVMNEWLCFSISDLKLWYEYKDWYYLSYAYKFPEKTTYAMSRSLEGPWENKGILNEVAGNCNTNHQAIVNFKNNWLFIYHNGSVDANGGSFRRSVCIDKLFYNKDGSLKRVLMTSEGVSL